MGEVFEGFYGCTRLCRDLAKHNNYMLVDFENFAFLNSPKKGTSVLEKLGCLIFNPLIQLWYGKTQYLAGNVKSQSFSRNTFPKYSNSKVIFCS